MTIEGEWGKEEGESSDKLCWETKMNCELVSLYKMDDGSDLTGAWA